MEHENNGNGKLPQKFTFGEEKSPKKPKIDKEEESLWEEMIVALMEGGTSVENETKTKVGDVSGSDRCAQGMHDIIFDEEIGEKCRRCHAVITEVKDVDLWSELGGKKNKKRRRD